MTQSPEPISDDRLERLLGGATPESEREASFAGVVRELRANTPGASAGLRERVLSLPSRTPRPSGLFWSRIQPRRFALVLAPAALIAVGAGAAVYSVWREERELPPPVAAAPRAIDNQRGELGQREATTVPSFGAVTLQGRRAAPSTGVRSALDTFKDPGSAAAGTSRVRDVGAFLRLRVPNPDQLSEATNEAMRVTRTLGGYVAYVDVDTTAKSGRATLTLRVPVDKVEDAMVRLSDLGTITGQHVQVVDRQVEVDRLARRISSLRVAVAETRAAILRASSPGERARLQVLLERQKAALNRLTRQRGGIVREASFARIDFSVVTGKAPKGASTSGPFGRAAGDALHALAVASAAALFVLILLAPFLVLAVLIAFVLRSRRRRIEERLLERLGPAAGQPAQPAPGPLP